MLIIQVMGVPELSQEGLKMLRGKLKYEATKIKELEISVGDVTVFFLPNLIKDDLGEEIIIFVRDLFKKPKRTPKVRQRLAEALVLAVKPFVKKVLPQCKMIEVFVHKFNPEQDGFEALRI